MFPKNKKLSLNVSKKFILMMVVLASPVIFIATSCGSWDKTATGPTGGQTLTATAITATFTPTTTATVNPASCPPVYANPTALTMGTAGNFVILGEQAISNSPTSSIIGNIGIYPNGFGSISGFSLTGPGVPANSPSAYDQSSQVTGKIYSADAASYPITVTSASAGGAIYDMLGAYNAGAGYATNATNTTSLGGLTLERGVYGFSGANVVVPTALTLCGGPTDVFVFQITGTLDVSANIILTGGVLPTNVFWIVAGGATIEAGFNFNGMLLSGTAISVLANSTIVGGLYAQSSVSLISDNVSQ